MHGCGRRNHWEGTCALALLLGAALAPLPALAALVVVQEIEFAPAGDGAIGQNAGRAVAIDGSTAAVAENGIVNVYTRSGSNWTLQAQLTGADGASNDGFGFAVALSGNSLLVGAPYDRIGPETGTGSGQGSVYAFQRIDGAWRQSQKLIAADGQPGDRFGEAVALASGTAVIGASGRGDGGPGPFGAAFVFVRAQARWTQQAMLIDAAAERYDGFGQAVAVHGDTVLVGAYDQYADAIHGQSGLAHVFVRNGTAWSRQASLVGDDSDGADFFGYAVAVHGDTALIGAMRDNVNGETEHDRGSAYVFVRSGGAWTQQAHLFAPDGVAEEQFGNAVALHGDTALVAAASDSAPPSYSHGSAHVFGRSGTAWSPQGKLLSPDGVSGGDAFGRDVALSLDSALIGVPGDSTLPNANRGTGHVFVRSGPTFVAQARLDPAGGALLDGLGYAVAGSGDTVAVGVPGAEVGLLQNVGVVAVYLRSDGSWTQQALLAPSDGLENGAFGTAVALAGDLLLVGAPERGGTFGAGAGPGSVYVFTRHGGAWSEVAKLRATGGAEGDAFGSAIAVYTGLQDSQALIGAPARRTPGAGGSLNRGAAYLFSRDVTNPWAQRAELLAADGAADSYADGIFDRGDRFGASVALTSTSFTGGANTLLIGAPHANNGGARDQGAAYVFTPQSGAWPQQAKLVAAGGLAGDRFGSSVAASRNTAYVGAPFDDVSSVVDRGSLRLFARSGTLWTEQPQLLAADGADGSQFGASVAGTQTSVLVGAPGQGVGSEAAQGVVYYLANSGGGWSERARLVAPNGAGGDRMGSAVAWVGDGFLAGIPDDSTAGGHYAGSARVFRIAQDFGDALDPGYPTLRSSDGARHHLDTAGPRLGTKLDSEPDGATSSGATADDIAGTDDEDGVTFGAVAAAAEGTLAVTVAASGTPLLDGWLDFNRDGDWDDAGERILDHVGVAAGTTNFAFPVPADANPGLTTARLRISNAGTAGPGGLAADGEVEDHAVTILPVFGGTLSFHAATYTIGEAGPVARIYVTRSGSSAGAIHVRVSAAARTATAGADFVAISDYVYWADGDASPKRFNVPIVEDALDEPEESVKMVLSEPGGNVTLGTRTAIVKIVDND